MAKKQTPAEALAALAAQREELLVRIEQVRAEIATHEARIEDLAYDVATGEPDGDRAALTAAEDAAASGKRRAWELQAALRGTEKRLEIARHLVEEEERKVALARLDVILEDVPTLSRTLPSRIDELADTVIRINELETEAKAIAAKYGIRLGGRYTARSTMDIIRERLGVQVLKDHTQRRPLSWQSKATEALRGSWERLA